MIERALPSTPMPPMAKRYSLPWKNTVPVPPPPNGTSLGGAWFSSTVPGASGRSDWAGPVLHAPSIGDRIATNAASTAVRGAERYGEHGNRGAASAMVGLGIVTTVVLLL